MTTPTPSNFWATMELLARRRALILTIVLLVTLGAVVVSLILPKWYDAQTLLLPPKDVSSSLDQMSKLTEVVSVTGGLNLPVMVTPSDVYARILRSQRITDRIVAKFNLQTRYNAGSYIDTYAALMKHARFAVTQEGLLSISVEDRDAQVAADMANAFADELDSLNREIMSERARRNRQFIELRLNEVKASLDSARSDLETFQQTNRAVDFDAQTRLAIDQAANLKVTMAQLDLQINMGEQTLGRDNPELLVMKQRREFVKGQLKRLETGGVDSSFFSLPVASIPGLKGKYELLYGRVRISESLYNMLLEQLEKAKLQEAEQTPTISVLDRARPSEVRSRPQRTLIVGGSLAFSFVFALLLAAFLNYLEGLRERQPEDYRRAVYVIDTLLGWIPGVKRRSGGA